MDKNLTIEQLYDSIQVNIEFIEAHYTFGDILRPFIGGIIALLGGSFITLYEFFPLYGILVILTGFVLLFHCLRYFLFLRFIKVIKIENPAIYKINTTSGDIGKILESIEKIYSIAKYFQTIKAPQLIDNNTPSIVIQEEGNFLLMRMKGLQGELESKLKESLSILESAKSEVESTIKGSTELSQISELQSARLDRQIEQFEELERVLMKT